MCTDYWGRPGAKVVCRQLGFPEGGKLPQQLSSGFFYSPEKNTLLLAGKEMGDSITLCAQGMRRNLLIAHIKHILTIEDAFMQEWHAVSKWPILLSQMTLQSVLCTNSLVVGFCH